jgi:hypothetical protein
VCVLSRMGANERIAFSVAMQTHLLYVSELSTQLAHHGAVQRSHELGAVGVGKVVGCRAVKVGRKAVHVTHDAVALRAVSERASE